MEREVGAVVRYRNHRTVRRWCRSVVMKIISYNIRGLGSCVKRREILNIVKEKKPDIMCIQESKMECMDEGLGKVLLGSSEVGFSFKPSAGASGGIITLWNSNTVEVVHSASFDHVLIIHGARLVNSDVSRCVCGDFNSIRSEEERKGRGGRVVNFSPFNSFIEDAALSDLPLCGRRFTWYRGDGVSMSRLDRFLLSEVWCQNWPNCLQIALPRGLSDHCPIVLSVDEENWGPKPFHMLRSWSDMPRYKEFVIEKWRSFNVYGWGGFVLKEKLKLLKGSLKEWHLNHGRNIEGRIKETKDRIHDLDVKGEGVGLNEEESEELRVLSSQLLSLSSLNCRNQWQKSRLVWLKDGDANSKFFHGVVSSRRRGNAIHNLVAKGHQSPNNDRPGIDNLQFQSLSSSEAYELEKPFTEEEVKQSVWDCESFKSLGPDGVNFGFVKDFWPEIKGDFMRFMLEFYSNGKLVRGSNSTFIVLIPKISNPQCHSDFCPISLVGCLYKVLAKVLANRLRSVIGKVISETQSTFVKGRQILDGILIANELVDDAKRNKKEMILFKVDFEKAYDSVDWSYLEARSEAGGSFISPFLFLLAAEGLNVMLKTSVNAELFKGYMIGDVPASQICISHLQFADDTLIVGEKSWANIRAIKALLILFELVSGLKVNFHKSMLVGVNVDDNWLFDASYVVNCKIGRIPFIYLGLPIGGNPRRHSLWIPLLEKIRKRLSGWKSRFLSMGGRLVLLKSVLSSLSVYFLSFFKAPAGIIRSIESLFKSFLWGGSEDIRKINWVKWDKVCLDRDGGGLGVRRIREFNLSLLGKWSWRLLTDKDGLWFKVLVAKYGMTDGRISGGGRQASLWWKDLCDVRDGVGLSIGRWFENNISRKVGNGEETLFWKDRWLEGGSLSIHFNRLFELAIDKNITVADMYRRGWVVGGNGWRWRRHLFAWEEDLVLECCVVLENLFLQVDVLECCVYHLLTHLVPIMMTAHKDVIWNKVAPLKVSLFAWRLLNNRLPSKDNLTRRGMHLEDSALCLGGCGVAETIDHLIIGCEMSSSLWIKILNWLGTFGPLPNVVTDHVSQFCNILPVGRGAD
ncbi:cysteine-rich receptor-like protein kinase [Trifolium pratense]|uniref:Cysteine-rich receptor-like protein kinase n=1 Tax=Trifolium pratense TaxID=57577 RepID=A0A2K3PF21_TRIPR|nr:cysteine-rich receptor-like protein kinase [Trifolium pratense]